MASFFLSLVALAFCLAPHLTGRGGWVASTVGITAAVLGVAALKQKWMLRSPGRILAVLGTILGVCATALMILFIVSAGAVWPAPFLQAQPADAPAQSQPMVSGPARPVPPSEADNGMGIGPAAGTLVFLLQISAEQFGNYPAVLAPSSTNEVVTPAGTVQLPPGAAMAYQPWPDGRGFDLTVTSASGGAAFYDWSTGSIKLR